jgi:hypothetical protein
MREAVIGNQRDRVIAPTTEATEGVSTWATLYRAAAVAAVIAVLLVPIQIAVFALFPYPDSVSGWFALLQDNPLAALVDLDLLLVVDNVLLVAIALATYVAVRSINVSITAMALGLWLLSLALLIAANPAIEMLGLSQQFAAAGTDSERAAPLAAGEALLATWEGTAFQVSYIVGQLAGITMGWVMLKSSAFNRWTAYTLIAGNVLGFGYYLPTVGLAISALSGVVLWVWFGLIARNFWRLSRAA